MLPDNGSEFNLVAERLFWAETVNPTVAAEFPGPMVGGPKLDTLAAAIPIILKMRCLTEAAVVTGLLMHGYDFSRCCVNHFQLSCPQMERCGERRIAERELGSKRNLGEPTTDHGSKDR